MLRVWDVLSAAEKHLSAAFSFHDDAEILSKQLQAEEKTFSQQLQSLCPTLEAHAGGGFV